MFVLVDLLSGDFARRQVDGEVCLICEKTALLPF